MISFQVWTDFYYRGRGWAKNREKNWGKNWTVLAIFAVALTACQTTAPTRPGVPNTTPERPTVPVSRPDITPEPEPEPEDLGPTGLVPAHMEGQDLVRIGLLLPFSATSQALREEARSMLNAAQMALFKIADKRLVLMPKDTGGTSFGARSAANAILEDGADIILGPVLGDAVRAVSAAAQRKNIKIIAFSTDSSVAGNGVYLLSFLPEADVKRMIAFISTRNHNIEEASFGLRPVQTRQSEHPIRTLALLRPGNGYGDRIESALFRLSAEAGLAISDIARYGSDTQSMRAPASEIAYRADREAAIRVWRNNGGIGDPGLDDSFGFSLPYQAVFIPENGVNLRSLAPLLPINGVDPKITQFIGTSLWNDEDLQREPALFGAWFPSPPADGTAQFTQSYEAAFNEAPSRLASLAHDAIITVSQSLSDNANGVEVDTRILERFEGFRGADGLFRFNDDGLAERALSVFEIRQGAFREIAPAAAVFERTHDGNGATLN